MTMFGGPVLLEQGAGDLVSPATPEQDCERVRQALLDLGSGGPGLLRIYRSRPVAAFAPRDTMLKGYAEAAAAMRAHGFAPVERRTGGQLAVYDEGALVIDLVAPHPDPRPHVIERFADFSGALAAALINLGIDARVGMVPGEYCPGDYSVNAGGRIKIIGVAQRINRHGYHMGAVVAVESRPAVRHAVGLAYQVLGLPFEPATFGAIEEMSGIPHPTHAGVAGVLLEHIRGLVGAENFCTRDALSHRDRTEDGHHGRNAPVLHRTLRR